MVLRDMMIAVFLYNVVFLLASIIFFLAENQMTVDKIHTGFFGTLTDVYTVFLTVSLTFIVLITIHNIRQKVKQLYLQQFTCRDESDDILKSLKAKTVMIQGSHFDFLSGDQFKAQTEEQLRQMTGRPDDNFILGVKMQPNLTGPYKEVSELKKLSMYQQVYSTKRLNKLALRVMPTKITMRATFNNKVQGYRQKAFYLLEQEPKHSSYSFVLFKDFEAIYLARKLAQSTQKITKWFFWQKKRKRDKNHLYEMKFLIDWDDIVWEKFAPKPHTKHFLNFLFKVLIFLMLLFLSSPAAVLKIIRESNLIDTSLLTGESGSSDTSNFFEYLLKAFLPPLIILLINKLTVLVIIRLSELISESRKPSAIFELPNERFESKFLLHFFQYSCCPWTRCACRHQHLQNGHHESCFFGHPSAEFLHYEDRRLFRHFAHPASLLRLFGDHNANREILRPLFQSDDHHGDLQSARRGVRVLQRRREHVRLRLQLRTVHHHPEHSVHLFVV
jgi:hypothetical protein